MKCLLFAFLFIQKDLFQLQNRCIYEIHCLYGMAHGLQIVWLQVRLHAKMHRRRHSFQSTDFDMSRKRNVSFFSTIFKHYHTRHHCQYAMWDAFWSSIARSIFVWHFMWIKHAFSIIFVSHTTCFPSSRGRCISA